MKILINSYPRSGTTTLVDATRLSYMNEMIGYEEDFFYKDKWIAKSHIPVIFLSNFSKDIVLGTVLRDPIDAISSNCFRWANGHTGNIVQGRIVVDRTRESAENKFNDELKDLIRHQTHQYLSYYKCLINNSQNIKMFHYEDVQNNIEKCVEKLIFFAGGNISILKYDSARYVVNNPPQPTKEKTELYYQIRDHIKTIDIIKECYSLYNETIPLKEKVNA
jgi:hypothetical protein